MGITKNNPKNTSGNPSKNTFFCPIDSTTILSIPKKVKTPPRNTQKLLILVNSAVETFGYTIFNKSIISSHSFFVFFHKFVINFRLESKLVFVYKEKFNLVNFIIQLS